MYLLHQCVYITITTEQNILFLKFRFLVFMKYEIYKRLQIYSNCVNSIEKISITKINLFVMISFLFSKGK